jgi:hypothetical protein
MAANIDEALGTLRHLVARWAEFMENHYSEADTRVKFIDPVLTQVLGWPEHPNITREESYTQDEERRSIDYTLSLSEPVLVVEAKQLLKEFEIPATPQVKFRLNGVLAQSKNAWAAVEQVRAYCDRKQAKYALVTNGRQFIAFQAITERPGGWTKGTAIVWRSPEDLIARFSDFYTCLSKESISNAKLSQIAGENHEQQTRHRPRTFLGVNTSGGYRNELFDVLEQAFGEAFIDVPDPTDEFLEHAYCASDSTIKYGKQLQSLLVDELPEFRQPIYPVKPGHRKDPFDRNLRETLRSMSRGARKIPLVVVMGGAGVGKTTFLEWYFRVHLDKATRDKLVMLHCDYRTIEAEPSDIRERTLALLTDELAVTTSEHCGTYEQMKEIFREHVTAAVAGELKPWANASEELERRISDLITRLKQDRLLTLRLTAAYLRSRVGRHLAIVLDNIDQKLPQVQIKLFQVAQEFATNTQALVIVVMREATYLNLMHTPQFNAFVALDFHVKVQPAAVIMEKRLSFVEIQLAADEDPVTSMSVTDLKIADVRRFVTLMANSLNPAVGDPEILRCLEAVSTSHTRGQLKTVYDFLVSGHTKAAEYLSKQYKRIPFHEFLSSILLEDRKFFSERDSDRFVNIFALSSQPNASHFTCLRIVAFLRSLGQDGDCSPGDFVDVATISDQFVSQGLTAAAVFDDLKRLAKFGLVSTESQNSEGLTQSDRFAVTQCGLYYLDSLYFKFPYYSITMTDTMMTDSPAAQNMAGLLRPYVSSRKIPIEARIAAARRYIGYLEDWENRELAHGVIASHAVFGSYRFTSAMLESLAEVERDVARRTYS